jgi:hypothetical protein
MGLLNRIQPEQNRSDTTQLPQQATIAWWGACIILMTAGLYWRRPDAFYNPQLWGEDATRFFSGVNLASVAETLVTPFSGYYHTLARLVAALGVWIPATYIPFWYAFASYSLLVAIVTYLFSARFPLANGLKFLMGLSLVATPTDNEVYFNLANWATLTSLFWILLAVADEPARQRQRLFDLALLCLTGLNSPFAICLWPLFVLRYYWRRTRHSLYLLAGSLLVAIIQVANMLERAVGTVTPPLDFVLVNGMLYRWGFLFLGESIYQLEMTNLGRGILLFSALLLGGLLFWHALRLRRWTQLIFLVAGLVTMSLSIYVMRPEWPVLHVTNGRHIYLPTILLIWSLLLVRFPWKWLVLIPIWFSFIWLTPNLKNNTLPDLQWAEWVAACANVKPTCQIPTQPVTDPPEWYATLNTRTFHVPPMQVDFAARFGDQLELLGYDLAQQSDELRLKLVWRALGAERTSYTRFLQLVPVAAPERIVGQVDGTSLKWHYPITQWAPQEIVIDEVVFGFDGLQAGVYQVGVGWYDADVATLPSLPAVQANGQAWPDGRAMLPTLIEIP